jgi:DNA-binding NarL/FixJ family response regulator
MIRVQIRASSAVVKAGLESLLQTHPSLRIVPEAVDEDEMAEGAFAELQADVVVAEIEGREDDATAGVLRAAARGTPVVLLVPGSASEWADVFRRGVKAVLPSSATGPQIAAATEAAAVGLVVVDSGEVQALLETRGRDGILEALPEALTAREIEVLRLLAEGLGNKEIAARLNLSEHTVKFHVASIMGKLGAASRTEAVMQGVRRGIVLI